MPSPEMESLLALGDADTALAQLRHRRATLPERAELTELATKRRAIEQRRSLVEADLGSVRLRQSNLEGRLDASNTRAEQLNRRIYGGEVSATRDLQAMLAEVEQLKARSSQLEDEVLAVMEEREPLDASVDALNEELAALGLRRSALDSSLASSEAEVDGEIERVQVERDVAAEGVPAGILDDYRAISSRVGAAGVARLVSGRCGGCHLSLPATELDRIRRLAPGEFERCDQCGRILVVT